MGGIGSGYGYRSGSRDRTSNHWALDIRALHRRGLIEPGNSYSWRWSSDGESVASIGIRIEHECVWLNYKNQRPLQSEWQSRNYPVTVVWTRCNYGGARPWFLCPGQGCGRRVAILYNGALFACRHCYGLNYDSQHEQPWDRALTRYQKIRVRLGAHAALGPFPDKPKGMHWRTYHRWCVKANEADSRSLPNWLHRLVAE